MDNTMAKFKRRWTKGRTPQWPNLNEGQRDGKHNGRTTQWPNLNEKGQRDGQNNGQI